MISDEELQAAVEAWSQEAEKPKEPEVRAELHCMLCNKVLVISIPRDEVDEFMEMAKGQRPFPDQILAELTAHSLEHMS